jgi:SAM-dependent methyltransferase
MSFISSRFGQFAYFDLHLNRPDWRGKRVLDFGGNAGNLLADPNSTIDQDQYWCIDVSRDAIEKGKASYPAAHWVFYNRYNFAFNPTGVEGLAMPDLGQDFDYILAYSVFSHIDKSEMLDLIAQLESRLASDGVLAFTFIDPDFNPATSGASPQPEYYRGSNLRQRLERLKVNNPALAVDAVLQKARDAQWCILANDDLYLDSESLKQYEENEKESYCTFYTEAYMRTIFPQAEILPPRHGAYPPSAESVLQHCCILRKGAAND